MGYGEWIRRQRKRLNLTQRELGRRIGATDSYISHLEHELRIPSWELTLALIRAFNLGADEEQAFLDLVDSARLRRARGRSSRRGGTGSLELEDVVQGPRVRVVDPTDGEELGTLTPETEVTCLALAPAGESVALGDRDGRVQVWRVGGDMPEDLGSHGAKVSAVAYTPDGSILASASQDGALKLWDARSGEGRCHITGDTEATALAVSADSERAAAGYADGTVRIWDLSSGKRLEKLDTRAGPVQALAFSADGRTLACAGAGAGLWDLETGGLRRALRGLGTRVHAVAFSADGRHLVAVGEDRWALWDQTDGEAEREFPVSREGMVTAGFLAGEDRIVTVSADGHLMIREIGSEAPGRRLSLEVDMVMAASLSPDGAALAVAGSAPIEADGAQLDAQRIAARLRSEPDLAAAYRDLITAYSDPQYRQATLTTLRSLAKAATST